MFVDDMHSNLINSCNDTKPRFEFERDEERYLSIFCFPDGKIAFHGFYNHCYSYFLGVSTWNSELSYDQLIHRVILGEWQHMISYGDFSKVINISREEMHFAYQLKYFCRNGEIVKYHGMVNYVEENRYSNHGNIGGEINNSIKTVYTSKYEYDEELVESELSSYKRIILNSTISDFEQVVVPLEDELEKMQYLLFGSEKIRMLFADCRFCIGEKYNDYMNKCH